MSTTQHTQTDEESTTSNPYNVTACDDGDDCDVTIEVHRGAANFALDLEEDEAVELARDLLDAATE